MKTLNLGCGKRKIKSIPESNFECVNLDAEASMKPDVVANFTEKIPFGDGEFDEVYLFHTIEHIRKPLHMQIFMEVRRVLKSGGVFYVSYPEFTVIVKNWLENKKGQREFWEKTIFGRQLYPTDFHVCAADSVEMTVLLEGCGFREIAYKSEPDPYNTIIRATACELPITRERLVFDEVINTGSR